MRLRHNPIDHSVELREFVQHNRRNLIQAELMLMDTLCDLAETERRTGRPPHARRLLREAHTAAQTSARLLRGLEGANPDLGELRQQLARLEDRIEQVKQEIGQAPPSRRAPGPTRAWRRRARPGPQSRPRSPTRVA